MTSEKPISPQYDIVGSLRDNQVVRRDYYDGLLSTGDGVEFAHEREKTEEERAIIAGLQAAFTGFGGNIGVDLASRLPRMQDYRFFSTKEDMMEDVRQSDLFEAGTVDDIDTLGPGRFLYTNRHLSRFIS